MGLFDGYKLFIYSDFAKCEKCGYEEPNVGVKLPCLKCGKKYAITFTSKCPHCGDFTFEEGAQTKCPNCGKEVTICHRDLNNSGIKKASQAPIADKHRMQGGLIDKVKSIFKKESPEGRSTSFKMTRDLLEDIGTVYLPMRSDHITEGAIGMRLKAWAYDYRCQIEVSEVLDQTSKKIKNALKTNTFQNIWNN